MPHTKYAYGKKQKDYNIKPFLVYIIYKNKNQSINKTKKIPIEKLYRDKYIIYTRQRSTLP